MKILDTVYMLNNSKKSIGCEMLHLGDTCKREAKYSRFVYTKELKHQAILRRRRRSEVSFCSGRRSGVACQFVLVSRERESFHFGVVSRT